MNNNELKISKYEILLLMFCLLWGGILRMRSISFVGDVFMIIHACLVFKYHGKLITSVSGILTGIVMMSQFLMIISKANITIDLYLLIEGLLGIAFLVCYGVLGYNILKTKK